MRIEANSVEHKTCATSGSSTVCLLPSQWKSHSHWSLWLLISLFLTSEGWWVGLCHMQSWHFDLCLTVNINPFHDAFCTALHPFFSPSTMEMLHRDTTSGGTGRKALTNENNSASPALWSALVWVPPTCDDNESRKEGNDFVSDYELIYESPVNWCLLWGDAYHVALLQEVWLCSSHPHLHDVFITESYFVNEIFMTVTSLT